jgi:hypothetical protein
VDRLGGMHVDGPGKGALIWAALRTDEATVDDLWRFGAGNRFSLEALRPEYAREDLTRRRTFAAPVIFMLGRHDWHVPSVLAAEYFRTIAAPCKRLVWFERSGHDPPFEQPDAFVAAMHDVVLPLATRGCADAGARWTGTHGSSAAPRATRPRDVTRPLRAAPSPRLPLRERATAAPRSP